MFLSASRNARVRAGNLSQAATRFSPKRKGFTFIEIMMVVLIIGIMAAVVGPRLTGRLGSAKVSTTKEQMKILESALDLYEMEVGEFPATEQGLRALCVRPSGVPGQNWRRYMKALPLDGWKREFVYRCPGTEGAEYDLLSVGKDGLEGTDDDIRPDVLREDRGENIEVP